MSAISTNVKYFILIAFCGSCGLGCNIINPIEPTPTYVHIDSFQFHDTPLVRTATLSHSITSVWVYYDNNPVGVFDLPATFPVITDGTSKGKLELYPGVSVNGLNNINDIYPFYSPDTSFQLVPNGGKVVTCNPKTFFYTKTKPYIISQFETSVPSGFGLAGGNIPLTIVDAASSGSLVFEGTGSGSIFLGAVGDSSVDSSQKFTIPSGTEYIEFNYKSDLQFYVGLQSNLTSTFNSGAYYLAGINPSDHWQKFYLNISQFITSYTGATYNFYIKTSLPSGQASGRLLLDNIQLVTF